MYTINEKFLNYHLFRSKILPKVIMTFKNIMNE